jgi:hypothetical protein
MGGEGNVVLLGSLSLRHCFYHEACIYSIDTLVAGLSPLVGSWYQLISVAK